MVIAVIREVIWGSYLDFNTKMMKVEKAVAYDSILTMSKSTIVWTKALDRPAPISSALLAC